MKDYPAPLLLDMYKAGHPPLYNENISHIYINFTNRFNTHCNIPDNAEVMHLGLQYLLVEFLINRWNETFFKLPKEEAVGQFTKVIGAALGVSIEAPHLEALHDLGYLPLEIKSLPEGVMVPYGVPSWTCVNTVEGFGWAAETIETLASAETWGISTSGTTAFAFRKRFEQSKIPKDLIKFLGHDFSYRGMFGTVAASMSGFGHLASFYGSDTVPAALFAEQYYGAKIGEELVFASVIATEHSIATSYLIPIINSFNETGTYEGKTPEEHWGCKIPEKVGIHLVAELVYLRYLMLVKVPVGYLSCVIDSLDFWGVVEYVLPRLKADIMSRDGKFICRPDTGNPADVLCGQPDENYYLHEGTYFNISTDEPMLDSEIAGLIECLGDIFGVTHTPDGKLLDDHIGAIYGDSINLVRQDNIIDRLEAKGFIPTVALGMGSFAYQYVTRDTHGSAIKATDIQLGEGKHTAIYKAPKTDSKKKSAKGLLMVLKDPQTGVYSVVDDVTPEAEASDANELKTVFRNGYLMRHTTLEEIRGRVDSYFA